MLVSLSSKKIVSLIVGRQSLRFRRGGFQSNQPPRARISWVFLILMSVSSADHGEGIDAPSYFLCPISLEIMRDPVTLPTGITYDRSSIERWIFSGGRKGRPCCPVTKQALAGVDADLTPNHTLRRLIQAWCVAHTSRGFERFPTPRKNPSGEAQIAELIEEARRELLQSQAPDSLRKLRSVVGQSEKNKRHAEAAGAPEFLVSVVRATCPAAGVRTDQESAGGEGSACEESLSILHSLQISTKAWSKLMLWNEDLVELLTAVLKGANRQSRACATAFLKPLLEALPPHSLVSLKQGLFEALVKVVRDQISHTTTKVALRILARLFLWGRNNVKAARAGAVIVLVDLLLDTTDRAVSEAAMVLLELLCRSADGRAELLTHAAGLAPVCKTILRVSPLATERAVGVLYAVSKFSATPAVVREMVQVGVVRKLCLVLQNDCSWSGEINTREMAKDILRLHSRSWKNSVPCFPQQLAAAGFIYQSGG